MNTHYAREYTIFACAHFLRKWHEQQPSNQGDLVSSVMGGGWEGLLHKGGPASDFIFVL
jgi:hypothetical protein